MVFPLTTKISQPSLSSPFDWQVLATIPSGNTNGRIETTKSNTARLLAYRETRNQEAYGY
jgi:hypothetical protein